MSDASGRYRGIDHVGIAVPDLAAARDVFERVLGMRVVSEEDVPDQRVRVLKLDVGGADLELLQSTDPDGPVGKFIAKRGAGVHHITIRVEDLPATLASLERSGVELLDRVPRIGAGGAKIAFLHPRSTAGVLIELCEVLR